MSQRFDPRQHLRELNDGTPYLDVKWRLHWLRSEHPEAVIETQLISLDGETAVCKATVRIPDGGSATGHASSARGSGGGADHIEHAETRAIGRALAALGYGTQFTEDDALEDRPAAKQIERPVSLVTPPVTSQPQPPTRMRPVRDDEDDPEPEPPTPRPEPREPVDVRDSRGPQTRPVREMREVREAPEGEEGEDEKPEPTPMKRGSDLRPRAEQASTDAPAREDISWTRFWDWAKRRGYRDAAHLRDLLGIDVNALTPGEVRDRIRRYELDNPPNAEE